MTAPSTRARTAAPASILWTITSVSATCHTRGANARKDSTRAPLTSVDTAPNVPPAQITWTLRVPAIWGILGDSASRMSTNALSRSLVEMELLARTSMALTSVSVLWATRARTAASIPMIVLRVSLGRILDAFSCKPLLSIRTRNPDGAARVHW